MAKLLYRLGRFSANRRWTVIIAWVLLLTVAGVGYLFGGGKLSDNVSIPGTATEQVQTRLTKIFGDTGQGSGTVVVTTKDGAAFTDAEKTAISAAITKATTVGGVASVTNPFTTAAARAAEAKKLAAGETEIAAAKTKLAAGQKQLDAAVAQAKSAGVYSESKATLDAQQAIIDKNTATLKTQSVKLAQGEELIAMAKDYRTVSADQTTAIIPVSFDKSTTDVSKATTSGVRSAFSGLDGVSVNYDSGIVPASSGAGSTELLGIVIAAIILIIMLGSFVTAGLPLLSAIVGVGVSSLAVLSFSKLVDMNSTTPILGLMLGLAVGIDYTLFIINRHRQQLKEGMEVRESIALATGTSGTAVLFAGATVIVALLALNITGIPFLGLMGIAGAAAITTAVLVALTLTPAMLSFIGLRAISKREWRRIATHGHTPKPNKPMSNARAILTVLATVIGLAVVAVPALSMELGLPDASTDAHSSTTYKAYTEVDKAFGAGQNGPLVVVADLPKGLTDAEVTTAQVAIGEKLMAQSDVKAVVPAATSKDNSVTVFEVLPKGGPNDAATTTLVHDIRDLTMENGDITFSVAGTASANIDISQKIGSALPPYLAIVIILSILIMIAVFRSLLVPVIATGGFILSLFAALGGVTAIFQFGWLGALFGVESTAPILSFLPVMLVGILFGLAMDYQLFIGTGIREAFVHGSSARVAVTKGLRSGRTVVTAAALIMAGVFGGFMLGDSIIIKMMGFGLAFGVLVDAFVVRMLLLPAIMHLVGEGAWWLPKWLDRILPNVDVEGATLERPALSRATHEETSETEGELVAR